MSNVSAVPMTHLPLRGPKGVGVLASIAISMMQLPPTIRKILVALPGLAVTVNIWLSDPADIHIHPELPMITPSSSQQTESPETAPLKISTIGDRVIVEIDPSQNGR
jgi:hypothetical protein